MEFSNSFAVDVPLDRVWLLMLDAQQVAPCVPGAQITESVDDLHHKGTVKVKLGAVQMTYRGELEMQPDESSRTIMLKARGSESRGGGGASGTFTTTLSTTDSGSTQVDIHTRVDVTGRVAQFGRGIMQDVATRMIKEFASCLERKLIEAEVSEPDAGSAIEVTTREGEPNPLPAAQPPQTATLAPSRPRLATAPAAEIRVGRLMLDITRSKVADGLRLIARIIEPRT